MTKIYGIVILYNPNSDVVNNIESYISELDKLYVYDNSNSDNRVLIEELEKSHSVEYIYNGNNDGISKAINYVISKLPDDGEWLLTMDQDSSFDKEGMRCLINSLSEQGSNIGLISPSHSSEILDTPHKSSNIEEKLVVMTSGNIINIDAARKVGFFDERYFIDCVDWDYCVRLTANKFKVIVNNEIKLNHGLGDKPVVKKLFFLDVFVCNYSHIRRYYITRNKLLFSKLHFNRYKLLVIKVMISLIYDMCKIIMFEDGKLKKIRFYFLGVKDFFCGNFNQFKRY